MSATQSRMATWWLIATPLSGMATGTLLGALVGLTGTPPSDEIGPLAGNPVASTFTGAFLGLLIGAGCGLVLGIVLMRVIGSRSSSAATRAAAAGIGLVGCPVLLLALMAVARVDLGLVDLRVFAAAGGAAGVICRWLTGPVRDRSLALHSGAPVAPR